PVRIQFQGRIPDHVDLHALAGTLAAARVRVVHIAVHDPFIDAPTYKSAQQSAAGIERMLAFLRACVERELEANLLRLPFCQVNEDLWPHVVNTPQFFRDHHHYDRAAYLLAVSLYSKRPVIAG